MLHPAFIAAGTVALSLSAGCDQRPAPPPRPKQSAAAKPACPPSSQSDAVRQAFRALGQELPPLQTASRGKGFEVLAFPVESQTAEPTWRALRALADRSGWYPVIFRDKHRRLDDLAPDAEDPKDVLAAAARIDPAAWFRERAGEENDPENAPPRQAGATAESPSRFQVPFDIISGKPVSGVFILLAPTAKGYEVPAYIPFGGWNDCPNNEEHVAILRSFSERFGADLVTMSGDILELEAARPPATDDAALALALEQYHYCNDIVNQGVGSVDALASTLKSSRIWFFWWD